MASIPDWAKPASSGPSFPQRSSRREAGSAHGRERRRERSGYGYRSRSTGRGSTRTRGTREDRRRRGSNRESRRRPRENSPEPHRLASTPAGGERKSLKEFLMEKKKIKEKEEPKSSSSKAIGPNFMKGGDFPSMELGKTTGMYAIGAWAARMEVARLLESKADPSQLARLIRSGQEGEHPLDLAPPMGEKAQVDKRDPIEKAEKTKEAYGGNPKLYRLDDATELAQMFDSSVREQQLLMDEIGAFSGGPDWADGSGNPPILFKKRAEVPEGLDYTRVSKYSTSFLPPLNSLQPPHASNLSVDSRLEQEESEEEKVDDGVLGDEELDEGNVDFRKKARRPVPEELVPREAKPKPPPKPQYGRPADERAKLEKFYLRSLDLFEVLVVAGVKMDLVDLVAITGGNPDGPAIDESRFKLHVEPKGAGTGLGYVRLMERLVKYHEDYVEQNEEEITPVSRATILAFTEHLISEEAGFRTPKALLYALDFYSVAFGFTLNAGVMSRCKKLSDTYASKKPPRKGADFFHPDMLEYLESVVNGSQRPLGDRLVAGRLRLCCQASVRHNDLARTPLRDVEWCRTIGTTEVRGIRAKVGKTKSGPRPCVASHLGVTQGGDGWLETLMGLLLTAHGSSWRTHDFFGVRIMSDEAIVHEPPCIQGDVAHLKRLLQSDLDEGYHVPLDREKIERLRFHGCKSTMVTIMQHFGIKSKVVRHAGAWAKQSDSMPDLYLRESQLLVLRAQEECLSRLRGGEKITTLEGVSLSETFPKKEDGEFTTRETFGGSSAGAMALPMLQSGDLLNDFRDDADHTEEILDEEKKIVVDQESVASLLEELDLDSSSDAEDEVDYELETHFLSASTGKGKIHKAHKDLGDAPKCGVAAKAMQVVEAAEAMSGLDSLCKRCFGPVEVGECQLMCTYREAGSDGTVRRCARRCALSCESRADLIDNRKHLCYLHGAEE